MTVPHPRTTRQVAGRLADPGFREAALADAVDGLRQREPLASASVAFVRWHKVVIAVSVSVVVVAAVFAPVGTTVTLVALATAAYAATMLDRLVIFRRGLAEGPLRVTDDRARAIPDEELPTYTVLVPAYNEPEVVGDLIAAMESLEYPPERLQVLLLLEADDDATITAASGMDAGGLVTVVLVPAADPRTKPKACNYGLHFATGEIVTIYDAEDLPDPLQLRRSAAAFADLGDDVACVQSKLSFHNGTDNVLTAWFTADYAIWFGYLLPGLMVSRSPIPLGGTSNHLRRSVLDEIGAWDPFNVTEDADLGVRIAENGFRTAVIDSVTMEEANIDPINWVRQRSRWYKGYMQTWLVHMRRPVRLSRALGPMGMFRFTTLLAGTPLIACMNMVFWLIMVIWFAGQIPLIADMFPPPVYYFALLSLVFGNSATVYMNLIALREDDRSDLFLPALVVPAYWVMMSVAALKGMYQMVRNPSYWEKTFHGLAVPKDEPAVSATANGEAESP
ncbi:glycosyltransferase [Williamsia sterculiae]|uniref:Glycosyltransferase, catalytic subunit of cellulose synthase and poly-beta-1,6-N-acetylglucosamine synthase n=1 Tax=Williamsia sterculiae TaxID=1344003 RepID=A0A1N7CUH0_9NOCA|nr:glycosyltransferase [Williamsia sterculiae]SIR67125.1 Glycosyltransferase, catalytic subunit of cellulose synthase and poly-beta-1,6-N-acetylglucosamine synthase [Williamsia sterculiae]